MTKCERCGTVVCFRVSTGETVLACKPRRSRAARRLRWELRQFGFSARSLIGGIAIGLLSPIIVGVFWFGA